MARSGHTSVPPFELSSGTMLGKFEVLRKLATGGMAEIYLARVRGQAGFEKLVVIKRILPTVASDPRLIQMFLDEARLVATFQHPNIADVHEVGEEHGAPFFAMEYVHGQDARSIRVAESERHQGVPLRVSLAIVHAVASALDYAHERCDANRVNLNLVHRDVSSSNILVSYEGAIKLIDFGVARVTNQTHNTQAGTVRGKCPYMSPEQCLGHPLDRRSDLFSLGVVMYELTVGRRPFHGASDYDIMTQIVHHDPAQPSKVTDGYPLALERIVMKLLARNVDERYQTAEQLAHELEAFLDSNHLWVPLKKLSRYMQTLFADRLIGWEQASRGDIATFAEHIALGIPEHLRQGEATPPTPLPVVMRLSQEIQEVAQDSEASLARVFEPGDRNDPLAAILGNAHLEESVAFTPGADTVTTRSGDSSIAALLDVSVAFTPGGDTVTTRTGEAEALLLDLSPARRPTTVASDVVAEETVTVRTGEKDAFELPAEPSGDTVTVRTGPREILSRRARNADPSAQHRAPTAKLAQHASRGVYSHVLTQGKDRSATATDAVATGTHPRSPEPSLPDDADSVARALHAPTFMAAIDALGSSETEPREERAAAPAPAVPDARGDASADHGPAPVHDIEPAGTMPGWPAAAQRLSPWPAIDLQGPPPNAAPARSDAPSAPSSHSIAPRRPRWLLVVGVAALALLIAALIALLVRRA